MASKARTLADDGPTATGEPGKGTSLVVDRSSSAVAASRSGAGPVRLAFTHAIQDWWYDLIPFAAMNLVWLVAVVTVVAGPPATAAMLAVARDTAVGEGAEPRNFFIYLRRYFWRSWGLGLVTFLGTIILISDMRFYSDLMKGNPMVQNTGAWLLLYFLIVWVEFLLVAWPLLVDQPEMSLRDVLRNAGVLTLRMPGSGFGLALVFILVCVLSIAFGVLIVLAVAAFLSLLAQYYLHIQAPVLANFPPTVGETAAMAEPGADEVQDSEQRTRKRR